MGISERKEREKQEMKQLIINAAMKMFLEEGYAKTSIRNIAEAIEYSPGTIYLYYKDKDELLYEVQREAFGKLLEVFHTKAISPDPVERLEQLGMAYLQFGYENPELYDLMFIIRAPTNVDDAIHKDNGKEAFNFLLSCLKECMDKGLVRFSNLHLAALQVWSMVHGLASLNIRCRLKVMEVTEEQLLDMIRQAVREYLDLMRT